MLWVKFSVREYLFQRNDRNSGELWMCIRRNRLLLKLFQKKIQCLFVDQFWIQGDHHIYLNYVLK